MRNAQLERDTLEKLEQRKLRGEEYDRVKLAKMKPPSFNPPTKKKLLFYVDVNITPVK